VVRIHSPRPIPYIPFKINNMRGFRKDFPGRNQALFHHDLLVFHQKGAPRNTFAALDLRIERSRPRWTLPLPCHLRATRT
jgi:hypothetical protein